MKKSLMKKSAATALVKHRALFGSRPEVRQNRIFVPFRIMNRLSHCFPGLLPMISFTYNRMVVRSRGCAQSPRKLIHLMRTSSCRVSGRSVISLWQHELAKTAKRSLTSAIDRSCWPVWLWSQAFTPRRWSWRVLRFTP